MNRQKGTGFWHNLQRMEHSKWDTLQLSLSISKSFLKVYATHPFLMQLGLREKIMQSFPRGADALLFLRTSGDDVPDAFEKT